ncbi:MAG: hypothetical protein JWP01_4095 [Myxococcales bacterium]|nr:hypothetical protein [Myxococcales bacterium]
MRASTVISTLLISAIVLLAGPAKADPNRVFSGRIMMSEKRYPTQAKSAAAYTAQIKKQSKTSFQEDKEKKGWKIHFIGFLKSPLNDVEYVVKIYELGGRQQQLLSSFEQFTDERGQKTLTSSVVLEKKQFGVNKELMITMENKGKVLASGRVKILGEGEKFSGKVNFSEDEAAGKEE